MICNQFLWIFSFDTSCHLQNQQINRETRYWYSGTWKKPLIKSTNQQCSATCYSEFLGLSKAPNWKINKSTAKRAINTQTLGINPIYNQQINSDMQSVPLNFWVWHTLSFTKSTNQRENALLILRDMEETPDKINKSTVFCNLLLWIFGFKKTPY